MNSVILSGRLTKKPELRTTQSGTQVCQFSLAVDSTQVDEEGKRKADFIECVTFGKTAENLVKYQDKGSMIELKGRLQVDRYVNKDNKNVSRTLVYVDMINYISQGKKDDKVSKNDEKDVYADFDKRIQNENDDLPF